MLELDQIESGYGETKVLHGVSLTIAAGQTHAVLGRNGVGKTTTLKTVAGQIPTDHGAIRLRGADIHTLPSYAIAQQGIAYVPETRDIFGALTVRENLQLASRLAKPEASWTIEDTIQFFPQLAQRLDHGGHQLSGGEQQMLAIGRALMTGPDILILDEPTSALGQKQQMEVLKTIKRVRARGDIAIIFITHNEIHSRLIADRYTFLALGQVIGQGTKAELEGGDIRRLMAGGAEIKDLEQELSKI